MNTNIFYSSHTIIEPEPGDGVQPSTRSSSNAWDDFSELRSMTQNLQAMVSNTVGEMSYQNPLWDEAAARASTQDLQLSAPGSRPAPLVNVLVNWLETSAAHIFKVDVPGIKRDELHVVIEEGQILEITGERIGQEIFPPDEWRQVERWIGRFMRRFRLPGNVVLDRITAELELGVLTVTIPKIQLLPSVQWFVPIQGSRTSPVQMLHPSSSPRNDSFKSPAEGKNSEMQRSGSKGTTQATRKSKAGGADVTGESSRDPLVEVQGSGSEGGRFTRRETEQERKSTRQSTSPRRKGGKRAPKRSSSVHDPLRGGDGGYRSVSISREWEMQTSDQLRAAEDEYSVRTQFGGDGVDRSVSRERGMQTSDHLRAEEDSSEGRAPRRKSGDRAQTRERSSRFSGESEMQTSDRLRAEEYPSGLNEHSSGRKKMEEYSSEEMARDDQETMVQRIDNVGTLLVQSGQRPNIEPQGRGSLIDNSSFRTRHQADRNSTQSSTSRNIETEGRRSLNKSTGPAIQERTVRNSMQSGRESRASLSRINVQKSSTGEVDLLSSRKSSKGKSISQVSSPIGGIEGRIPEYRRAGNGLEGFPDPVFTQGSDQSGEVVEEEVQEKKVELKMLSKKVEKFLLDLEGRPK